MWDKGNTAKTIGKVMGKSRNAIIGKAHRIGLTRSANDDPVGAQTKIDRPIIWKGSYKPREVKALGVPVSIIDLRPNQCRFPIGDPKEPDFHFCGAERLSAKPYCYEHHSIAYRQGEKIS